MSTGVSVQPQPNHVENPFKVSRYASKTDNLPHKEEITWQQLCAEIENPGPRTEKDGPAWSPVWFENDGTRKNDNVAAVEMLVYDFDNGVTERTLKAACAKLNSAYTFHSTFSHNPFKPKFRLIIPLKSSLPKADFKSVQRNVGELIGLWDKVDPQSLDESRLHYSPGKVPGYRYHIEKGTFLDWNVLSLERNDPVVEATQAEVAFQYHEDVLDEFFRRVAARGKTDAKGVIRAKGLCHNGKSDLGLQVTPETGFIKCWNKNPPPCTQKQILAAEGLPTDLPRKESIFTTFDKIESRPAEFLIKPYIPIGNITFAEGDPETCKTTVMLEIIGAISTGRSLPFHKGTGKGEHCLFVTAEDSLESTVKPRLEAAKADFAKVHTLMANKGFSLQNLDELEELIERYSIKLVVIDPLFGFVGNVNINSDNEVRNGITNALKGLAEKYKSAIVGIRHLSKKDQRNAKMAGGGSVAWTAAARSVLLFGCDPDNPSVLGFIHSKCNLAARGPSQGFRTEPFGDVVKVDWTGNSEITESQILSFQNSTAAGPSKVEQAIDLMLMLTADGDQKVASSVFFKACENEGISLRTAKNALSRMKEDGTVRPRKTGLTEGWEWYRP